MEDLRTDRILVATVVGGAPRMGIWIDVERVQVRYSADGRYVERNRPAVHQGRMMWRAGLPLS